MEKTRKKEKRKRSKEKRELKREGEINRLLSRK